MSKEEAAVLTSNVPQVPVPLEPRWYERDAGGGVIHNHYDDMNDTAKFTAVGDPHPTNGPHVKWVQAGTSKVHYLHMDFVCVDIGGGNHVYEPRWMLLEDQGNNLGQCPDPGGHPPGPNRFMMDINDWNNLVKKVINSQGIVTRDLNLTQNAIVDTVAGTSHTLMATRDPNGMGIIVL